MKVLHLIETRGPGGAEYVMLNIAHALEEHGYENFGFFIKDGWIRNQFIESKYKSKFYNNKNIFSNIIILFKIFKFIKKEDIDVIHAHEFYMCFLASIVSFFTGIRAVCTLHGMNYHCDNFKRRIILRFISKNSILVVVSPEIKKYISQRAKINESHILLIENGIKLHDCSVRGSLKAELGLSSDDILVGTVGRLHKVKGHEVLIAAATELSKNLENIYFFIAGEGGERGALDARLEEKGLKSNFFLLGNRADVDNVLSSCDIFVLPSLSEGTSLALLEALSFGLPVVATRVGNTPYLIKDKSMGLLVDPGNAEQIIDSVREIIENNSYKTKNNSNISFIENNYSFDRMLYDYTNLYKTGFVPFCVGKI